MAKKAKKAGKKARGSRRKKATPDALEPRPSFQNLKDEIVRLQASMLKIEARGEDQKGTLTELQRGQLIGALRALRGTMTTFECPQLLSPY